MKNLKITTALVFIIISFSYGYSNNNNFYSNEFRLCNSCLEEIKQECNKGIEHSEVLEFSSLYKYNAADFTTCDLNSVDSKHNLEDRINNKINEIRYHENHLHKITYDIKNKHKNMITSNTNASFNYVVVFDSSSTNHQEIIDYGIKLKL